MRGSLRWAVWIASGAALWAAFSVPAGGHGLADWIMRNPATAHCCGPRDCAPLAPGDVAVTPTGYLIRSRGETVPFAEALPSEDAHFWLCRNTATNERRCFFRPAAGL